MLDAETQEEEIIDEIDEFDGIDEKKSFHLGGSFLNAGFLFFCFCFCFFLTTYFWLCWGFVGSRAFLQLQRVRATLQLQLTGFSLQWPHLLQSMGSRCLSFSSCILRAQQLWHTDLIAPQQVKFSRTRIKPVSPVLASGLLFTVPPGKSSFPRFLNEWLIEAVLLGEILPRKLLWSECLCPCKFKFTS